MNPFWSDVVHQLTPYVPGEQPKVANLIKLNTNENPYPPSPKALAAIQAATADTLRLYPDPNADVLKGAIAAHYGVATNQVFVGNGSDEVLAHVFLGLLKHAKPLLFPDISYSFYPVYCGLYAVPYRTIPLDDAYAIRIEEYVGECGAIILPNPNAPTGRALDLDAIRLLAHNHPEVPVVIDEAYVDFGAQSAVCLVRDLPNLLVVQTLSKSRSLAGLRVGFAIGDAGLIEALERVKNSFNSYPMDRLALAGAVAAIEDREHFETTRHAIIASREHLTAAMTRLGFEVIPSTANFIFARHPQRDAGELASALRERAIIVRHFKAARIDQHLRITIGTEAECAALVAALEAILD